MSTDPIKAEGILIIHDDLEGVHLIATNAEDGPRDWAWLTAFLSGDETMQRVAFDPARIEGEAQVWPDLNAFANQFDIEIVKDNEDDS